MSAFKHIARAFVYPLITTIGIEKLFSALSKHNKLILVYHGVVKQPNRKVSVGPISLSQFTQHLNYLRKHFKIVSLETIFEMYRADYVPSQKTIALTFDDGYQNNYTNVYPLLKESRVPATIFVVTTEIANKDRITWYDYLDLIKPSLDVQKIDYSLIGESLCTNLQELKLLVKSLNFERRELLFSQIKSQLKGENNWPQSLNEHWKLMNKNEIRELSDSGLIEIGAHTHHHPNLDLIEPASVRTEVNENKIILEDILQKEVKSIAFPDGGYNDTVKQICLDSGFKNLLAVDYRCPSDINDKNILPRYCLSSTTTFESNMIQINRHFTTYGF